MKQLLIAILSICPLTLALFAQESPPHFLGQTDTDWKGVTFAISEIARVDDAHTLIKVRIVANATTVYPTFIGLPPAAGFLPSNPTMAQMMDEKYRPKPFSLTAARLVDLKSGAEYPAITTLPASPYWGPNSIITNLGPSTWIQLAVQFNAPPPPPPTPDGKIEPHKVTLILPKAKSPITGLILPRDAFKQPTP